MPRNPDFAKTQNNNKPPADEERKKKNSRPFSEPRLPSLATPNARAPAGIDDAVRAAALQPLTLICLSGLAKRTSVLECVIALLDGGLATEPALSDEADGAERRRERRRSGHEQEKRGAESKRSKPIYIINVFGSSFFTVTPE